LIEYNPMRIYYNSSVLILIVIHFRLLVVANILRNFLNVVIKFSQFIVTNQRELIDILVEIRHLSSYSIHLLFQLGVHL